MTKSVVNLNVSNKTQPLFFGEAMGIQRYDDQSRLKYFKMFRNQLTFMWTPEEVSVAGDKKDFQSLQKHEQDIFIDNLSFQILLDSCASRGVNEVMQSVTSPELECAGKWWQAFECLHSYSYTYIIKNVFTDPSKVFDEISKNQAIIDRATGVTKEFDALLNQLPTATDYDKKKQLYLTLAAVNILEGVRFYVSFACSYAFAENKMMEGNAKLIGLINRDENLHLGFTQTIMKALRNDESEGFTQVVKDCEPIVTQMFADAANEEKAWAEYLFRNGSILGLNADILSQYMEYIVNRRMKGIQMKPLFGNVKNPISWVDKWTNTAGIQVAPQETEISSYVSAGDFANDVESSKFEQFDLED